MLDAYLFAAIQVIVDIRSRFLFEQAVLAQRKTRTLSVNELCALMREAQAASYGDGLEPSTFHPYMWIAKPHYYYDTYYNWPYTFAHLLAIGLYASYVDDPDRFRPAFDDLLFGAGMATAADLAKPMGIDLADEAFWMSSLDLLRRAIDDFERLAPSSV
ncbi:MAG: hypothetical protein H0U86_09000 [Chloroflexi bacterium]|nr:hypothetical protein [Chloroflexota bacterium]